MSGAVMSPVEDSTGLTTGYRPWLDGVRALAIALVVVQHVMGAMPVELGSVGVGIFFALSGYLITSLLLDERRRRGAASLSGFYLRRAARLVPALVLVLVACDTIFVIAGDHGPLKGSLAALTYTANYAEIWRGDFVLGFGPTWSLAVEEHFYVLWPLALLYVVRRFGLRSALVSTLAICVAAVAWRALLALLHVRWSLINIGSVERADALLYGCAAAIAVRLGWRPRSWVVWAGIATVVASVFLFDPNRDTFAGSVIGTAVLAIGGAAAIVGLDYDAPAWLRELLSLGWVVAIGIWSYGIYLWHGPLMRAAEDFGYSGRYWRVAVVPIAIAAAAVSHRFVESPIRAWARRRSG